MIFAHVPDAYAQALCVLVCWFYVVLIFCSAGVVCGLVACYVILGICNGLMYLVKVVVLFLDALVYSKLHWAYV